MLSQAMHAHASCSKDIMCSLYGKLTCVGMTAGAGGEGSDRAATQSLVHGTHRSQPYRSASQPSQCTRVITLNVAYCACAAVIDPRVSAFVSLLCPALPHPALSCF